MKKKFELSIFSKVMCVVLGLLALLLIIASLMENAGYMCVYTNFGLMGTCVMGWLALMWGLISLFKKVQKRVLRVAIVVFGGGLVMFVSALGMIYTSQVSMLALESEYATVVSPAGDQVVVMRRIDTGMESEESFNEMMERMDARYEYIFANPTEAPELEPDATPAPAMEYVPLEEREGDDYPTASFGYVYTAYPRVYLLFYDKNADVEGRIYRGYESKADISFVWSEDGTVRFYLDNAEPGDSGEIIVRK